MTPLMWLAAAAPLALVLVLLMGLHWKASSAASAGVASEARICDRRR